MLRLYIGGLGFLSFMALLVTSGTSSGIQTKAGLTIKQDAKQVVLKWNGPVAEPMLERFQEAFRNLDDDERPIVISLNSPGGFVQHGREIVDLIHKESRNHTIDTAVEAGSSCASMCVPIYLVGFTRMAHPAAKFMFHEASFKLTPQAEQALRDLNRASPGLASQMRQSAVKKVTDNLFEDDIGARSVDAKWLAQMRTRIKGRDVWLTGKQLMEQGSGVVDKLM